MADDDHKAALSECFVDCTPDLLTGRGVGEASDLDDLPQNEKRMRLVEQAFQQGLVRDSEL